MTSHSDINLFPINCPLNSANSAVNSEGVIMMHITKGKLNIHFVAYQYCWNGIENCLVT